MVAYNAEYYQKNKKAFHKRTAEYHKDHTKFIGIRLNVDHDHDILMKLDSEGNKVGYIKQLIRDDIKRTGWQAPPSPKELEAQEREAERLAEVEKYHRIKAEAAEANGSDGKPVQSGDSEAEARKLFGM